MLLTTRPELVSAWPATVDSGIRNVRGGPGRPGQARRGGPARGRRGKPGPRRRTGARWMYTRPPARASASGTSVLVPLVLVNDVPGGGWPLPAPGDAAGGAPPRAAGNSAASEHCVPPDLDG